MSFLKPLGANFTETAHRAILKVSAELYMSKSEWVRQLVLKAIGMPDEISLPKTNAGFAQVEEVKPYRNQKAKSKSI